MTIISSTRGCMRLTIWMGNAHHYLPISADDEGNRQVLMKEIIDYRTNGEEVKQQEAFITTRTGTK